MRISRLALCLAVMTAVAAVLAGCASLGDLALSRPTAEIAGIEIENVTFERIAVRFDVKVSNPNAVGVRLAGSDYRLSLDGVTFLEGTVDREISLAPRGESIVPVPVEVAFRDVVSAVRTAADHEESRYEMTVGLVFQAPMLDRVRVEATRSGTLPVIRIPRVSVASLRLDRLSLQGAALTLGLQVDNPNGFLVDVDSIDYTFTVSGEKWASGDVRRSVRILERGTSRLELPIELSFGAIGQSARNILSGAAPLSYALKGRLRVHTSLPILKSATIPVDLQGEVRLAR